MRAANLLPPILAERQAGRRRARQRSESAAAPPPPASPCGRASGAADVALERARCAGGPIDNACYTCACGFVFAATVSTTVNCPHCGAAQAW
jgi:hypothetical protein